MTQKQTTVLLCMFIDQTSPPPPLTVDLTNEWENTSGVCTMGNHVKRLQM